MIRILLVDDDKLVCTSLKTILSIDPEIQVEGMGNNGLEAYRLYEALKPDLLLMDIRMEPVNGLEAGEEILSTYPDAKILYLTTFLDDEYIIKALHMGAKGYMLKQDFDGIIPAIKAVMNGHNIYGNEIVSRLPDLLSKQNPVFSWEAYGLTEKENEILLKIADGLSNREIADTLFLSEGTVRNYISCILEKLELRDRTQIAIFYYKHRS